MIMEALNGGKCQFFTDWKMTKNIKISFFYTKNRFLSEKSPEGLRVRAFSQKEFCYGLPVIRKDVLKTEELKTSPEVP